MRGTVQLVVMSEGLCLRFSYYFPDNFFFGRVKLGLDWSLFAPTLPTSCQVRQIDRQVANLGVRAKVCRHLAESVAILRHTSPYLFFALAVFSLQKVSLKFAQEELDHHSGNNAMFIFICYISVNIN